MWILDDPWYIQESLENSSDNTLQAQENIWFRFQGKQVKEHSSELKKTSSNTLPETPKHLLSKILDQPIQDLDDKWFQFDDPWFVYDEEEKEEGEARSTKKSHLESKPAETGQQDELKPPPGILEEFIAIEKAWGSQEEDEV